MAKYSYEFKMNIVRDYLDGKGGYTYLSSQYRVDRTLVRKWIANYMAFGEESLRVSRQNQVYTFEFKLHVVELYLTSETSYRELATQIGVTNPSQIAQWVTQFRAAGVEGLKPKKKGRKRTMDKEQIISNIENGDAEDQKEFLRQLQEENLRLRIENAFLKEVRRLRLEEEALLRKQRESSTASEENSN